MAKKPTPTRAGHFEVQPPSAVRQSPEEMQAAFRTLFEFDPMAPFDEVERALVQMTDWANNPVVPTRQTTEDRESLARFCRAIHSSVRSAKFDLDAARTSGNADWARGFIKGYNLMKLYKETREEHVTGGTFRIGLATRDANKQRRSMLGHNQQLSMLDTKARALEIAQENRRTRPAVPTSKIIQAIQDDLDGYVPGVVQLRRWVTEWENGGRLVPKARKLS